MGPDSQVQVLPKLLQFCQDLFGRAEVLQILRELGQQIKVPLIPRGEDQLGRYWEGELGPLGPPQLSLSTTHGMSLGSIRLYLGAFPPS
jgi:hypothetical protein